MARFPIFLESCRQGQNLLDLSDGPISIAGRVASFVFSATLMMGEGMVNTLTRIAICFALWIGTFQTASAELIPSETFDVAGGSHSASAIFSLAGQVLDITLSNTYSAAPNYAFVDTEVLTGLFFDVVGSPALTKVYAMVPTESAIVLNGTDITASETSSQPLGTGDISAAWAYKSGTLAGVSQRYGISASGLNIFGSANLFYPGGSLPHQQGTAPNGVDYGLMPLSTTNYTHDGFSTKAFIQSSATFEFSGFTGSLSDIHNVRFQYGTAIDAFSLILVPEPSVGALLISLAFPLGLWLRRRRR
jgi:hypothetical protein